MSKPNYKEDQKQARIDRVPRPYKYVIPQRNVGLFAAKSDNRQTVGTFGRQDGQPPVKGPNAPRANSST